jgi:hypothetical protein
MGLEKQTKLYSNAHKALVTFLEIIHTQHPELDAYLDEIKENLEELKQLTRRSGTTPSMERSIREFEIMVSILIY